MTNTLGFDRPPSETRVVVAMSGGVDSSVAAAVLKQEGYDVVGITLQLYDQGAALGRKGACCAGQDIYDARRVAERLDMPHYVLDYENRFSQAVMDDFADSYLKGETPIPCVRCNQRVKFRDLLGQARDLGAQALATGHYVRRAQTEAGPELRRGSDPARDQSYFLFATTPEQLDFLRFPVGHLSKADTRAIAARLDLPVADKPDSQDICFVPDGDYARVVRALRPEAADPGEIVATDGTVLGRHAGIVQYTVGQRRGLNLGGGPGGNGRDPLYVVGVDAPTRRVTVGPRAALARDRVRVREVNWLAGGGAAGLAIEVKLRSAQPAVPARLSLDGQGGAMVALAAPQFGVAPGQAAVFYHGERLLGGGWIAGAELSAASAVGELAVPG